MECPKCKSKLYSLKLLFIGYFGIYICKKCNTKLGRIPTKKKWILNSILFISLSVSMNILGRRLSTLTFRTFFLTVFVILMILDLKFSKLEIIDE